MRGPEKLHIDGDGESLYAEFWQRGSVNVKARVATGIVLAGALSGIALLARSLV